MKRRKILFCSPNMFDDYVYLPLTFGLLKTYSEKHQAVNSQFEWLAPIYRSAHLMSQVDRLSDSDIDIDIDVIALGCYLWNSKVILKIADFFRQKYPNSLTSSILLLKPNMKHFTKYKTVTGKLNNQFQNKLYYINKHKNIHIIKQI